MDAMSNTPPTGVIEVTTPEAALLLGMFMDGIQRTAVDQSDLRDLMCSMARKLAAAWPKAASLRRLADVLEEASAHRSNGATIIIAGEDEMSERMLQSLREHAGIKPRRDTTIPKPSVN